MVQSDGVQRVRQEDAASNLSVTNFYGYVTAGDITDQLTGDVTDQLTGDVQMKRNVNSITEPLHW